MARTKLLGDNLTKWVEDPKTHRGEYVTFAKGTPASEIPADVRAELGDHVWEGATGTLDPRVVQIRERLIAFGAPAELVDSSLQDAETASDADLTAVLRAMADPDELRARIGEWRDRFESHGGETYVEYCDRCAEAGVEPDHRVIWQPAADLLGRPLELPESQGEVREPDTALSDHWAAVSEPQSSPFPALPDSAVPTGGAGDTSTHEA